MHEEKFIRLVIQIPALNEEASISNLLERLPRTLPGIAELLVLVINDGSTDATALLAEKYGAIVINHDRSRGVGAAFRSGLTKAVELGADVLVTIDADGQFNPDDIETLIMPILRGEADFVSASRFKDPDLVPVMPSAKIWGNRVIARWLSHMTGHLFYDVSCGFRAYSPQAFLRLIPQGNFTYTHEVFLALAFSGLRILEVPVAVRGVREHGESRVAHNLLKYAWNAALIILATYRDYRPLVFFGSISAVLAGAGTVLLAFVTMHWFNTGELFPYRAVGFIGGALCGSALQVFLIGLVAAMLVRIRNGVEMSLYRSGAAQRKMRER